MFQCPGVEPRFPPLLSGLGGALTSTCVLLSSHGTCQASPSPVLDSGHSFWPPCQTAAPGKAYRQASLAVWAARHYAPISGPAVQGPVFLPCSVFRPVSCHVGFIACLPKQGPHLHQSCRCQQHAGWFSPRCRQQLCLLAVRPSCLLPCRETRLGAVRRLQTDPCLDVSKRVVNMWRDVLTSDTQPVCFGFKPLLQCEAFAFADACADSACAGLGGFVRFPAGQAVFFHEMMSVSD